MTTTINKEEIQKFSKLADDWWDVNGKFKPLHMFNPIRIEYIKDQIKNHFKISDNKINFLNLKKVDTNKFPSIKLIKNLKNKDSLIETIIVLANDELVNLFLLKKINFTDITSFLQRLIYMKEFKKLRFTKPGNIKSIFSLNELVRKKINKFLL